MASDLSSFEQFCGDSPFWNETLLLSGSYPQFTECFQHVGLVWIPCFFFLAASLPYGCYLYSYSFGPPLPHSVINVGRSILACAMLILSLVVISVRATDDRQDLIPDVTYVSEGLKALCFLLAIVFIQVERRKGVMTTPIPWLFWIFSIIGSIVPFYTKIAENTQESDMFGFVTFFVHFSLLVLALIFASCLDKRKDGYQDLGKTQFTSPELTATLPNQLTIWWMTKLVISGFKKTLTENDVFDLTPSDVSDTLVPRFEEKWEAECKNVESYNNKIRPKVKSVYKSLDHKQSASTSETSPLIGHSRYKKDLLAEGKDGADGKDGKDDKAKKKKKEKSPFKEPSLIRVLLKTYGILLIGAQVCKTLCDLLSFATPKITEALLNYVAVRETEQAWKGYVLAASYLVVSLLVSLGSNQSTLLSRRLGMRIKSALTAAIYKKSLTISNDDTDTTAGEIVNLMSVDCQRIEDVTNYLYMMVSTPFQLALCLYLLYEQLDVAVFAGLGVMLVAVPINGAIGHFLRNYNLLQMKYKDERMRAMTETLSGIKVLKLYAWEGSFEQRVQKIRDKELAVIKKSSYVIALLIFIFNAMPYMVQLTAFGVHIQISPDGYLSPTVAFVSLSLFNMLNIPLTILPLFIPMVVQAGVSITRISSYLNRADIKPDASRKDPRAANAVSIIDGNFTWDKEMPIPTLRNINLEIKPGSLTAVVGTVGSGKSSLLNAMLGEMERLQGQVTIKSPIAYVPQEAWIQNATLRDNILFGKRYERRKYDDIIEACALKTDLEILPGGDKTEIGEKGINVSGGQKQRVSLARAVYSDQDIFLLDDPLSAVDSHVGKHIFNNVISHKGVLKGKTRILVTHGVHWLPLVDQIVVLSDGRVSEVGSYEELLSKDGAFAQFLKEHLQENLEDSSESEPDPEVQAIKRNIIQRVESVTGAILSGLSSADEQRSFDGRSGSMRRRRSSVGPKSRRRQSSVRHGGLSRQNSMIDGPSSRMAELEASLNVTKATSPSTVAGERLIEEEMGATGKVKLAIYFYYFRAIGLSIFAVGVFFYACFSATSVFSGIWLSMWTDDPYLANTSNTNEQEYSDKTSLYLGIYGAAGIGQGIFILIFAIIAAVKMTDASGVLHNGMLKNVVRAPMSFFDTTPGGRIVNRFSRDVEITDNMLPGTMRQVLNCAGRVLTTIITISYGTPIFLSVMVPLAILYVLIQVVYIPTSRQLRRIDSITRSPIYVHFSETLSGASSIRAYRAQDRFIRQSKEKVDHNFKFYFAGIAASTWLGFRLQLLGNIVVFAAAIFAVASTDIETGLVGLSVSYASQMTGALEFLVNMMSEVETNIVSVERIKEYTYTPREATWIIEEKRPDPSWPQLGNVEFQGYETRYRPGLDLVLKGLSCTIKGGEKIGIVGRTGAGKSSMTVALFRIIEAAGGKIVIDGLNISDMGLHDLRSKLTILPQEPVIFSGTLRMNLDPFEQYSDQQLWEALEHAYLKTYVESLPQGLEYECGENGSNLSVGQRQLVCLARTLLRKTKILVLDEATAAVDFETDELIQKTIRTQFQDNTILTIAHRLNTILDYDRVMVLDQGLIKEFDAPNALLSDKNGVFYGMAKDAGLV